ncbi:MAG: glycosyltransferase [Candidatus Bathyarchaeia archaeon]
MFREKWVIIGIILLFELLLIAYIIPGKIVWITLATGASAALYFLFMARKARRGRGGEAMGSILMLPIISVILPIFYGWLTLYLGKLSLVTAILATALTVEFFTNFLAFPLSIYHKHLEMELIGKEVDHWPTVSIIVPAYNEEKVIDRCLEALIEVDYPRKDIIVVDDGSTDGTLQVARGYLDEGIKVFHRDKSGGKSAALNMGILFAKGEIVVTCDADSMICRRALRTVVKHFEDPEISAVAGNVKVLNRKNLATRCQALEYIINENIYRRIFDVFGVVPVVPGPLAAFRKSVLEEVGRYDSDTLTEDFDITVKALKTGKAVQALTDAYVYTEAPESWRDFIGQRLRWNRGTYQNLIKHRNVFGNPRFGYMTSLTFPYIAIAMVFIPLASLVSIITVVLAFFMGYGLQVLIILVWFIFLYGTYSFLAIQLDDEDMKLLIYAPLMVVGYKELRHFIKMKSFIDVLLNREMEWGKVTRLGE